MGTVSRSSPHTRAEVELLLWGPPWGCGICGHCKGANTWRDDSDATQVFFLLQALLVFTSACGFLPEAALTTVLLLVWCVQMWRLADCSAILGCESTLTGMDGLASELQGPPGSDPSVLDYRHCNWLLHGARDRDLGPHGCAASTLPTEPSPQACYSGACKERLPFLHSLLRGQDNHFSRTWCGMGLTLYGN